MQPSDDILVKRVKNGDMDAFELLVRRYENKVYTVAYRFLGSHADASDLAQETFTALSSPAELSRRIQFCYLALFSNCQCLS